MSGVKRYDYGYKDDGFGGSRYLGLIEKPDGKLVLASDYDRDTQALKAEIERYIQEGIRIADQRDALRAQVEEMRAALEVAALAMWNSEANMDNEAAAAEEALAGAALQAKP